MIKQLIFILVFVLPFVSKAQSNGHAKKKISYAQGTLFGYWGYNRSLYTKSDMTFVGPGYDFTLNDVVAIDRPETFNANVYFNLNKLTIPQFNARVGYYFKNNWAISIGYDHMKYIFADKNEVLLSGVIDAGVDTVSFGSGTYNSVPVITDRPKFHYENSDGLNYIRFELTRTDTWLLAGKDDWFAFSTNIGVAAGGLLSFNDFTFAGQKNVRTISMSGYGVSLHTGLRFEFFKHFFIQPNLGTGYHNQLKVRTRPNDASSYAKHSYGYLEFDTVIGFFLYLRPTNACDSCPEW